MGNNMRELFKDQIKKNVCSGIVFFIIITLCLVFFGCTAKNEQHISNSNAVSQPEDDALIDGHAIQDIKIVKSIEVKTTSDSIHINIIGDQALQYTSIKQSFPFGIAIYLPNTIFTDTIDTIKPERGNISNIITSYADTEKKTAKIEILLNKDIPYSIETQEGKLVVILPSDDNESESIQDKDRIAETENTPPPKIPKGIAKISNIEFSVRDSGDTELKITTSHPIKYAFSKGKKGILFLNLYNTIIPYQHKRPYETKYFKSAVYRILPIYKKKNKNSKIEIDLREHVPYKVVQKNNILAVSFEPSSIRPPKFAKADRNSPAIITPASLEKNESSSTMTSIPITNNKVNRQKSSEGIESNNSIYEQKSETHSTSSSNGLGEKLYTGEKIKLDFYETDIKNVFRILSSLSNKNFAIDKNVTGNVTLTLEHAIPWDQVLDLVLSMNQLGKIETGDVIRIATLPAISAERRQQQMRLEAIRKAKKSKLALEPLKTEYIPINYADASSDILPHIKPILTSGRGSATVDRRTNMIIINDTQANIDKAKSLIYTLDNVTPQILIKAKIVEANKDFSRSLGLGLKFGFNEKATPANNQYSVSMNSPVGKPTNVMSFTFNNAIGNHFGFGDGGATFINTALNAAESKGNVEILSSPKILTLDNVKATIKQGIEFPYNISDGNGNTTTAYKNVDLLLEVTPHVTPDKRISLNILLTKNDIAGIRDGVPTVSTNEAKTTLLVNNNDTIMIGGVIKSKKTMGKTGFPYLQNIPLLGRLFRTDTDAKDKQELLIFITPTIVQLKQKSNILQSDQDLESLENE